LTDEKWRAMLDAGEQPPLADWMGSFYTDQGEYTDLTRAVFQFQQMITSAYWELGWGNANSDPALAPLQAELQALLDEKKYIAHQLVNSQFRSFDLQSDTQAVVTVRETWQDKLYQYSGDYANYDEALLSERGPYSLDATYMIEERDGFWQVTQVVYADQPPEW
jgi:hypothetical protein